MSKETVQAIHLIQKCMEINKKQGRLKISFTMKDNNFLLISVKDTTTRYSRCFVRASNGHESEIWFEDSERSKACNIIAELEKLEGNYERNI